MSRHPSILRLLWSVRKSYRLNRIVGNSQWLARFFDDLAQRVEGQVRSPSSIFKVAVGQYLFSTSDGGFRVCIDVHDSGDITSPELLEWSNLYFKTNFWRTRSYPSKVVPMINVSPVVLGKLSALKSLRGARKEHDLCFIVRIWTGINDPAQTEHNVRLLEEISKVECRKVLFAYLTGDKIGAVARRLDKSGIPWATTPMKLQELWRITAQSRISILRLGVFYCVPWRMIDLLAMGACPVLDRVPFTVWPEVLEENKNLLSFGLDIGLGKQLARDEEYAAIGARLKAWLANTDITEQIATNNAAYFDRNICPHRLGEFLVSTVESKLNE